MTDTDGVVIVTGASSGIGRACASRLLEQGARVIGIDQAAGAVEQAGYRHVIANVSDENAIETAVADAHRDFGAIRGLANVAGVFAAGKPMIELSLEEFTRVLEVNLIGTFVVARAVARRMVTTGGGKIVNVACIRSAVVRPGMADYAASKGGVAGLTRAMAVDLAPHGIQVNAVAPGFTTTGMTAGTFSNPEVRAARERLVPAGRVAAPDDIAGPILFLLSRAADYITGQVLFVDGGFSICK